MDTKLVDKCYVWKELVCFEKEWQEFLRGNKNTFIEPVFKKVEELLNKDRWIFLQDKLVYDHKIKAAWLGIAKDEPHDTSYYNSGTELEKVLKDIQERYKGNYLFDLPTKAELTSSLTNIKNAPFGLSWRRPKLVREILYKDDKKVQRFDCDSDCLRNSSEGYAVPILRLAGEDNFELNDRQVFFRWVVLKLIPEKLANDQDYIDLIEKFYYEVEDFFTPSKVILKNIDIAALLLNEDKKRADLTPYPENILQDINLGHWSLWDEGKEGHQDYVSFQISRKSLVARNPKSSIIDGVVAIDFGTKSTVVAYQKEGGTIHPMRIGVSDLFQQIKASHYENPTVIELNDLKSFREDYQKRDGRPYTKWNDVTISHTAFNAMVNSKSEHFNAFISELKQWAGNRKIKLKVVDKQGYVVDFPPFMELNPSDINPIEIYAYYLGLYINNLHNGIFLNYILSFPVTYEIEVRKKILESFKQGIKKSLPQELHFQPEVLEELNVEIGSSEPAAYAFIALEEYDFDPEGEKRVFFAVFDFGGGTTDFDFGIFREADPSKKRERRYDYVIEHFGAGGDKFLGGENLLALLAFEVFKNNKDKLLESKIQFVLSQECEEFAGSEMLLSNSREAKLNTKLLMEELRGLWEEDEEKIKELGKKSQIELNLVDMNGQQHTNVALDIDVEELKDILKTRIKKGIYNFFERLREICDLKDVDFTGIDSVHIFLAGNSSKSSLVRELFEAFIKKEEQEFKRIMSTDKEDIFKSYPPLEATEDEPERPTGKTGVAFGLIETRKSGNVLVIDKDVREHKDIAFKYYLGLNKKKKFKTILGKDTPFNKWIRFIDASVNRFEVYYSSDPIVSTNSVHIPNPAIKKKTLKIEKTDEDGFVYIRLVSPTTFEYAVFHPEDLQNNLTKIESVEL